jgi:hypothetical protein
MSWPFQMFPAPELLDGSLACDAGKILTHMSDYKCSAISYILLFISYVYVSALVLFWTAN